MRATCWVIPKTIWNRFADHPANSRLARPGAGGLDEIAALPRVSTGLSIKGESSYGHRSRAIRPAGGCRGFARPDRAGVGEELPHVCQRTMERRKTGETRGDRR